MEVQTPVIIGTRYHSCHWQPRDRAFLAPGSQRIDSAADKARRIAVGRAFEDAPGGHVLDPNYGQVHQMVVRAMDSTAPGGASGGPHQ